MARKKIAEFKVYKHTEWDHLICAAYLGGNNYLVIYDDTACMKVAKIDEKHLEEDEDAMPNSDMLKYVKQLSETMTARADAGVEAWFKAGRKMAL